MRRGWARLGLRGRLALSIGTIVVAAFGIVFVAVRAQMADEASVIQREEGREHAAPPPTSGEEGGDGSRISPISDAQSDVEKTFLLVGGTTLVAALLAGYLLAARTASPLQRFAHTASEIDAGDLTPRLQSGPGDAAELRILAEAFNHMLDRLDRAFARQRQFVSDASHELRSPLTALRGQLEVLARQRHPSEQEVRRVEAVALREIGRVERLVEDMLSLARLDEGVGPALQEVSAADFLRELADARHSDVERLGDLAEGTIELDPDLVAQVVRNLLDNAGRYAGEGQVAALGAPRGQLARRLGRRRRPRHPGAGARAGLRPLPPPRLGPRPRQRGQRPGPWHRPRDRVRPRRPDLGRRLAAGRRQGQLLAAALPAEDERSLSERLDGAKRAGRASGRVYRPTTKLRDGVAGNARLTGAVAAALLVLLAAEGATIPFIGRLLGPHIFIGMLLIPPVALKLGSTGYRFARYYTGSPPYKRKGPPLLVLRVIAPGVVLTTLALFGTGVALLVDGPPGNTLLFAHKASFIAWVALMTLHVLGHLLEVPSLAAADWRRAGPPEARLSGAGLRTLSLATAILAGVALAALTFSAAQPWL